MTLTRGGDRCSINHKQRVEIKPDFRPWVDNEYQVGLISMVGLILTIWQLVYVLLSKHISCFGCTWFGAIWRGQKEEFFLMKENTHNYRLAYPYFEVILVAIHHSHGP